MSNNTKNLIILAFFASFLALWFYMIITVRVNEVTLDDTLSLLSKLPIYYPIALFALTFTSFLLFRFRHYSWSVALALLFAVYTLYTPFVVEPLHNMDSLFHLSRVLIVEATGHLPSSGQYYFDYPGVILFGTILTSITGIDLIPFAAAVFPALFIGLFCLFFVVFVRYYFGSKYAGLSLIIASLSDFSAFHFSPEAYGSVLLPLLLLLFIPRSAKARVYSVCFTLIVITLTFSHPTISAFLLVALALVVVALFIVRYVKPKFANISSLKGIVQLRVMVFHLCILSWATMVSFNVSGHIALFANSLVQTLFNNQNEVSQRLLQPEYIIYEISILRRIFVGLSIAVSVVAFLVLLLKIVKTDRFIGGTELSSLLKLIIAISLVSTGLVLLPSFLLSTEGVFAQRGLFFGLLGVAIGLPVLGTKSGKSFALLFTMCLLLIVPAFVTRYPAEQYDMTRTSVMVGLSFTGSHVDLQRYSVLTPLGTNLYYSTSISSWKNIIYPVWGEKLYGQARTVNYVVWRIDGQYYDSLQGESAPINVTSYYYLRLSMLNSTNSNLVYSSGPYEIYENLVTR